MISMSQIYDVIIKILKGYCTSEVGLDTDLFKCGLDSFNAMNVLVEIEKNYNIRFEEDDLDLTWMSTVESIIMKVKCKLEEN